MTICYFGDYDPGYNRTRVIQKGLKRIGAPFIEVNVRRGGLSKYLALWKAYRALPAHDVVFIGYSDSRFMPIFAKLITRRTVVWDALYSLYDNWVLDRKLARPHSLKACWYWFLDWLGCRMSDLVVLDTNTNCEYFARTFFLPRSHFARVLVGADDEVFTPAPFISGRGVFEIEFHGKYIPVQGADVLVRAAKILERENVHFTMIGGGQEAKATQTLAEELKVTNVTFLPFLPQEKVKEYIRVADVAIGLVGDVPRVVRAIPNKMYEAAAMGRVSINVDSTSLREVFTPGADAIGVAQGSAESLANAILELKKSGRAREMGEKALATFRAKCAPEVVAQGLIEILNGLQKYHKRVLPK